MLHCSVYLGLQLPSSLAFFCSELSASPVCIFPCPILGTLSPKILELSLLQIYNEFPWAVQLICNILVPPSQAHFKFGRE